jgi:hypothetical protein
MPTEKYRIFGGFLRFFASRAHAEEEHLAILERRI